MRSMKLRSDLDELRSEFPGWQFGSVWASAASGPDVRRLFGARATCLITAWTAAELAARVRQEEADERQRQEYAGPWPAQAWLGSVTVCGMVRDTSVPSPGVLRMDALPP